ncbi:ribosomal protein S5 domain 2-like protein [Fomitiporia mediterranea MF3/22]|uniref:ribosomal protein S5 domain 2-like protein n=1 Tax=Fomitiporia mediterranea (strain MF3/22) TaxID=694068 RepID=UPI00044093C2|nr:ribosomal protein S5 domain 2-like protein [Fomitiporia mediterranea MF3/22]EJD01899.1 ribosomal protein S5 domain 2-like protein [Fomitiporia mediterranea MF3/22]
MPPSNLDGFVTSNNPPPTSLATSTAIHDRDSTFIGTIYRASSPAEAQRIRTYHKHVFNHSKPASHEISAWRCMVLKKGKDGLGGPDDFELTSRKDDDGEDRGGQSILRAMEKEGVIDVVVIVSRWFGGTLLGPVRFTHIETCTREVCQTFKAIEEVEAAIEELKELDDQLAQLRAELATLSPSAPSNNQNSADGIEPPGNSSTSVRKEAPDYRAMLLPPVPDVVRAKRLVNARQNAIRSVKGVLARTKEGSANCTETF